jgi:hypothetical protein
MKVKYSKSLTPSKIPTTIQINGVVYVSFALAPKRTSNTIVYKGVTYYQK